jgi:hypothetical protein
MLSLQLIPRCDQTVTNSTTPLASGSEEERELLIPGGIALTRIHATLRGVKRLIVCILFLLLSCIVLLYLAVFRQPKPNGSAVKQNEPISTAVAEPPSAVAVDAPAASSSHIAKDLPAAASSALPAEVEQPLSDAKEHSRADILSFVRSKGEHVYRMTRSTLGTKSLPILYELLKDRDCLQDWNTLAPVIAYLGPRPESFKALVDYVQRRDSTEGLQKNDRIGLVMGKARAVRGLALAGGNEGKRLLASLLVEDGYAEDFLKAWIHNPRDESGVDYQRITGEVRGSAAHGLVLTRSADGLQVVKDMHLRMLAESRATEAKIQESSSGSQADIMSASYINALYSRITGALAANVYIDQHGVQDYLDAWGSMELTEMVGRIQHEIELKDEASQ